MHTVCAVCVNEASECQNESQSSGFVKNLGATCTRLKTVRFCCFREQQVKQNGRLADAKSVCSSAVDVLSSLLKHRVVHRILFRATQTRVSTSVLFYRRCCQLEYIW